MKKRSCLPRLKYLLLTADVEPLRFFIAVSSLLWALLLFFPDDTFSRSTYSVMKSIGSEHAWASAHLLHGVASLYSLLTGAKGKIIWGLDPILGCLLWTTSGVAMLFAVYPVPAAIAPHLVGAVAAWWLLVRYKGCPSGG